VVPGANLIVREEIGNSTVTVQDGEHAMVQGGLVILFLIDAETPNVKVIS
jgi:hypothetical protein